MLPRFDWYHDRVETSSGTPAVASWFTPSTVLVHLVILALFGVVWPWTRGVNFFDPVFLAAYACLGVLFSGPAAAQLFSDPPRAMREALARVGLAVLYGEIMALLILAGGIATVLITRRVPIGPDWIDLAEAAGMGLAGSLAMAAVAGWVTLRYSPAAARQIMRAILFALLVLFFYKSRWLPDVLGRGTSMCLGVAFLALFGIHRAVASRSISA